jgi:hypothetical protein
MASEAAGARTASACYRVSGRNEQWLAENPATDLQAFVRQHGDWRRLPPDVWASFAPQEKEDIKANGSYRAVTPSPILQYARASRARESKASGEMVSR